MIFDTNIVVGSFVMYLINGKVSTLKFSVIPRSGVVPRADPIGVAPPPAEYCQREVVRPAVGTH